MSYTKKSKNVVENPTKILCSDCNDMVQKEAKISNSEKNKGKEYFRCPKCGKFLIWTENSAYDIPSTAKEVESITIKTVKRPETAPGEPGPCVEWQKFLDQLIILNKNMEQIIKAIMDKRKDEDDITD